MADTEAAAAPKEKKKKRSVKSSDKSGKSSEKSSKAVTPEPDSSAAPQVAPPDDTPTPQINVDESEATPVPPITAEEALMASLLNKGLKYTIAGEVSEPLDEESERKKSENQEKLEAELREQEMLRKEEEEVRRREKKKSRDEEQLRELAEAFHLLDFNQDGLIDKQDLQMTYATLGSVDIPDSDIQHMLEEADSPLDFESFVKLLGGKKLDLDSEETILRALARWDSAGTGLIPEERFRHDLMTWGERFSEQEVDYALEDAPLYEEDEGIMIDYVEYCKTLCGLRND